MEQHGHGVSVVFEGAEDFKAGKMSPFPHSRSCREPGNHQSSLLLPRDREEGSLWQDPSPQKAGITHSVGRHLTYSVLRNVLE